MLFRSQASLLSDTLIASAQLGFSPQNPNVLYVYMTDYPQTVGGVYKSVDGGQNWTLILDVKNRPTGCCDNIGVHPSNPDIVFLGGSYPSIFRSLDGGKTWASVAGTGASELHADGRSIVFSADGNRLYFGNDGGAYSTTNITTPSVTWTPLNATLAVHQFYPGLAIHPTNPNIMLGGAQDNGVSVYQGDASWQLWVGGDGGYAAFDFNNPSTVYAECQAFYIFKSTTLGQGWSLIMSGINQNDAHSFIPPFIDRKSVV